MSDLVGTPNRRVFHAVAHLVRPLTPRSSSLGSPFFPDAPLDDAPFLSGLEDSCDFGCLYVIIQYNNCHVHNRNKF